MVLETAMIRATGFSSMVLGLAACLATVSLPAAASDWPRFRGPNGTGISTDEGVPVDIGERQNLQWKVEIPGTGNSSPIVSKQRVFLQTASDDGTQRLFLCLDLANGKVLWSRPAPGGTARTHPKNTLASCSATADGTRVYVPFWDGINLAISAFDYEGKPLWTRDLGPIQTQHGAGQSPIVVGSKVILANDQDGKSEVVALDTETGKIAWSKPRPAYRSCYSTPFLLDAEGDNPEILVANTFGVAGYDPQSGSERWQWSWETNERRLRTVGSPVVSAGRIYLQSGDGKGDRQTVAVNLNRNANAPSVEWELRKLNLPYVPCMLTRGEHLYFVNDAGMAACIVAKTGDQVWLNRLDGGGVTASPIMVEDRIYAFTENGNAVVFAADPAFSILSSSKLDEGVMASPAVADSRLLVRGQSHLYCFAEGAAKGAVKGAGKGAAREKKSAAQTRKKTPVSKREPIGE
jgi:outer membrane protein assembly factor BamB